MRAVPRRRFCLALLVAFAAACNGNDSTAPPQYTIEKAPQKSGDQQTAPVGTKLGNNLRVLVTRDGNPAFGVSVSWFTSEGALNPTASLSDADGIAATSWTLGPTTGTKAATANVTGAIGSPLAFTAQATPEQPPPSAVTIEVLGPSGGANRFDPVTVSVLVGTTVTWHWPSGSLGHNVVADDGLNPDGSGALADGEHTYSFTFTTPGTYRYYCANHGGANGIGMSGIVIVGTTQ